MANPPDPIENAPGDLPNGPAAAAILAAGVGSSALGIFALAGDAWPKVKAALSWWRPTGPLSGVAAATCLVWLAAWWVLARLWRGRNVNLAAVNVTAFALLAGGVLLTFPPFMDLLQGK